MELPFIESGRIVGGIGFRQHQELSFGHIKFEMPLQTSKWKGQGAEVSSVRERSKSLALKALRRFETTKGVGVDRKKESQGPLQHLEVWRRDGFSKDDWGMDHKVRIGIF